MIKLYLDLFLKYQDKIDPQSSQNTNNNSKVPRVQIGSCNKQKNENMYYNPQDEDDYNNLQESEQDPLFQKYNQGMKDMNDLLNNQYKIQGIQSYTSQYLQRVIRSLKIKHETILDNGLELIDQLTEEQRK